MFVLNASEERRDTFKRTITIRKPSSDPSGFTEHQLTLVFRELGQDAINAIYLADAPDPADPADAKLLKACIVGWEDVNDETGSPAPFTPENLAALVNIPYVRNVAARDYVEAIQGAGKSERKRKN